MPPSSALLASGPRGHSGCRASSGAACSTSGRRAAPAAPLAAAAADRRRHDRAPTQTPTPLSPSNRLRLRPRLAPAPNATFFDQAWGTQIDGQSLASQLFSVSLLPYLGFLYHLRKPEARAPPLVFGGFVFLLVFVFATIPAGIYAKKVYGTSLANVDWLHGGAESLLTVTNLLLVVGLRRAIRDVEAAKKDEGEEGREGGDGAAAAASAAAAAKDPASR